MKEIIPQQLSEDDLAVAKTFHQFDARLEIQYDDNASLRLDKNYWRVTKSFKYYVGNREDDIWVHVPAGYLTDGASVPRPFWSIVPPWGRYGQAAVVHDLLVEKLFYFVKGERVTISRHHADRIFLEAMKVAGVNWFLRHLMYRSVSLWSRLKPKTNKRRYELKQRLETEWSQ